jgi:hypothetical protein
MKRAAPAASPEIVLRLRSAQDAISGELGDPPNAPFWGVFICSLCNWPALLRLFYFGVLC